MIAGNSSVGSVRLNSPAEGCTTVQDRSGWTTTGVLQAGGAALLVNAWPAVSGEVLRRLGVDSVAGVLVTHHRREILDGLFLREAGGYPEITAPEAERNLFEHPEEYWSAPQARWNVLVGHTPYHVTHVCPIPVSRGVREGDQWEWCGFRITVLDTPGWTDGAVSYIVGTPNGRRIAFVGDLVYGDGALTDLYTLQHFEQRGSGRVGDYHGWLGSAWTLLGSLKRVLDAGVDTLVPAHGPPISDPSAAVDNLEKRLRRLYANYADVSALRWYFPEYFGEWGTDPDALPCQETFAPPPDIRRVVAQTWLLVSDRGRALLMDPCSPQALEAVGEALNDGSIRSIDGIWITHYHSDHMGAVNAARERFGCPVTAERHVAEVLSAPNRYLLTCLAPERIPIDRVLEHGETWRWENFTMTAWHLPGQTYYHGGLSAVRDDGAHYLFVGDSFTPTGIDDYCMWNRNFLDPDTGFRACLRLVRQLRPSCMINPHVEVAFRFSPDAIRRIDRALVARSRLIRDLSPWDHPDFATDELWVHCMPYEQEVRAGGTAQVEVRIRNPMRRAAKTAVGIAFRGCAGGEEWRAHPERLQAICPAKTEIRFHFAIQVPANAGGRVIVPVDVTFDGRPLGAIREFIVNVLPERGREVREKV